MTKFHVVMAKNPTEFEEYLADYILTGWDIVAVDLSKWRALIRKD